MLGEILKKKGIKIEIVSADVVVRRELVPEFKVKDVSYSDETYRFYQIRQKDTVKTFLSKKSLMSYLKEIIDE